MGFVPSPWKGGVGVGVRRRGGAGLGRTLASARTQPRPRPSREGRPPLLLEDVGGALVAGEEVGALGRLDERRKRLHPREQADEIVLPAEGEDGVDQVVTDAGLALLDF